MKLTRERIIFASLLGIAVVGFSIDRLTAKAAAADGADESATLLLAHGPTAKTAAAGSTASASGLNNLASLLSHVQKQAATSATLGSRPRDPFAATIVSISDEHLIEVGDATQQTASQFVASHHLTSILQSTRGGAVVIDGQLVRIGQRVNGFQLLTVGDRSAVFCCGNVRAALVIQAVSHNR